MKLFCLTDLHLEFNREYSCIDKTINKLFNHNLDYDYIVLSGDIDILPFLAGTLEKIQIISKKPIIYVVGNHEFYNYSKEDVDKELNNISTKHENIIILNRSVYETGDYVFIGATGWYDGSNGELQTGSQMKLNDYRLILNQNIMQWGLDDRKFFENKLNYYHVKEHKKIICVTHNPPLPKLKRIDNLDAFFRNDWEFMIYNYDPIAWICGHTHDSMDFTINNCRMINNPKGYYLHGENEMFNQELIVGV